MPWLCLFIQYYIKKVDKLSLRALKYLYNIIVKTEEIVVVDYLNIIVSIVGILLPLIIFIDVGMSQSSKKTSSKTKKTDWFFQNEQFDRKYDDRADRNQYKF